MLEDGVEQQIVRFDRVENLPFHAAILLDNSASMGGALDQARFAALRFFQQALTPRDRAAVITFNRFPNLAVKFTNDPHAARRRRCRASRPRDRPRSTTA